MHTMNNMNRAPVNMRRTLRMLDGGDDTQNAARTANMDMYARASATTNEITAMNTPGAPAAIGGIKPAGGRGVVDTFNPMANPLGPLQLREGGEGNFFTNMFSTETPYMKAARAQQAARRAPQDAALEAYNSAQTAQAQAAQRDAFAQNTAQQYQRQISDRNLEQNYPDRAQVTPLTQSGAVRASNDFGMAPPAPAPAPQPQPWGGEARAVTPTPMGIPNHVNLRTSENQSPAPSMGTRTPSTTAMPTPGIAAAAPAPSLRPNSFADAAGAYSAANPQTKQYGTTTVQQWAAPGRSTGQPNAQDMAAAGGFAQRDAAKLAKLNTSGSFVDSQQPGLRTGNNYQGSAAPAIPAPVRQSIANDQLKPPVMKNGGQVKMHCAEGGDVPGKGRGDKIPALYEPGEFVVSNDMLKASPGLREQLHDIRSEVLAAKGMTPDEADYKATHSGKGLRALESYEGPWSKVDPTGVSEFTKAEAAARAARVGQSNYVSPGYAQQFVSATEAAAEAAKPVGRIAQTGNAIKGAASGVLKYAPIAGGIYETGKGIYDGDRTATARGALDVALGGAALVPGLQAPALAAMAVHRAPGIISDALGEDGRDAVGGFVNHMVRGAGKIAGQDWGVDDSALVAQQDASKQLRNDRDPHAAANAAKIAALDAANQRLTPPKAGDTRNVDWQGMLKGEGTEEFFNGKSWDTRTTAAGKQAQALRDEQYQSRLERDALNSRADTARQLAFFEKLNGTDANSRALAGVRSPKLRSDIMAEQARNETARYNAEMQNQATLRGQNITREGHQMTAATARAQAQYNMLKDQRDFGLTKETHDQTVSTKARENTAKEFTVIGEDGKPDLKASQDAHNMIRRIFPGIDNADEATKNDAMVQGQELLGMFQKVRSQDKVGMDALKFWRNKRPALGAMPDVKGLRAETLSGLDGVLTVNGSNGETLVKRPDGSYMNFGVLNANQTRLLEQAQKSGWGK